MNYGSVLDANYAQFSDDEKLNYGLKIALSRLQTELNRAWYQEPKDFAPKGPESIYKNKLPSYADITGYYLIDPFCTVNGSANTSVITDVTVGDILNNSDNASGWGFGDTNGSKDFYDVKTTGNKSVRNNSTNITNTSMAQQGLSYRMFTRYRYWENGLTGKNSNTDGTAGSSSGGTNTNKTEPENAILSYVGNKLSSTRTWKAYDDNLGKGNSEDQFFTKLTTYSSPIKIIHPDNINTNDYTDITKAHPFLEIYIQVPTVSTRQGADTANTSGSGNNANGTDNIGFFNPILRQSLGDVEGYKYVIRGWAGSIAKWGDLTIESGATNNTNILYFLNNPGFILCYGVKDIVNGLNLSYKYPPLISFLRYTGETFSDGIISQGDTLPAVEVSNDKDLFINTNENTIHRLEDNNGNKKWILLGAKEPDIATEFSDGLMSSTDKRSLNTLTQSNFQNKMSASSNHFFHILDTGEVMGCGRNSKGTIGDGTTTLRNQLVSMKITGNYNGSNAISVSSGSQSTAVLLNTGEVMTTGYNYYGNLGLGNTNNYYELQSVPPTGNYDGTNAIAVSMGNQHMCILLDTGEVMSCGSNDNGYLGNGEDGSMFSSNRDAIKDRLVPMSHSGNYDGTNAMAISCGSEHTLVLLKTGEVMACGSKENGKLGSNPDSYNNSKLISMLHSENYDGTNAVSIVTSRNNSHILLNTGVIMTCGKNQYSKYGRANGPLPGGTHLLAPMETIFDGVPSAYQNNAIAISCSEYHLAALLNDNSVVTVGAGNYGVLGTGEPWYNQDTHWIPRSTSAVHPYNGKNAIAINCGDQSMYIMIGTGEIISCGKNNYGQIGIGNTTTDPVGLLTPLQKNGSYTGVSLYNVNTNIRLNILSSSETIINEVNDILNVETDTKNGGDALIWNDQISKWKSGFIGSGFLNISKVNKNIESIINSSYNFSRLISCGRSFSCVITNDGRVMGTGINTYGQLGNGNTNNQNKLTNMIYNLNYNKGTPVKVCCGNNSTAVLLSTGELLITYNSNYQKNGLHYFRLTGNGGAENILHTIDVVGNYNGSNIIDISKTFNDSLVILLNSGEVLGFGKDDSGNHGYGNSNRDTYKLISFKKTGNYNGKNAISISAGLNSSYILLNTGEVMCCGNNSLGQLGIDSTENKRELVSMNHSGNYNGRNAIAISGGNKCVAVLLNTGEVMTCGYNFRGCLGIGKSQSSVSSGVKILTSVKLNENYYNNAIAISLRYNTLYVLLDTGEVMTCGYNNYGQLGIGSEDGVSDNPILTSVNSNGSYNKKNAVAISTGEGICLILLNTGEVMSIGNNSEGGLGDDSNENRSSVISMKINEDYNGNNIYHTSYLSFNSKSLITDTFISSGKSIVGNFKFDGNDITPQSGASVMVLNDTNSKNTLINPNGSNVGIGTNNPQAKLHIAHTTNQSDGVITLRTEGGIRTYAFDIDGHIRSELTAQGAGGRLLLWNGWYNDNTNFVRVQLSAQYEQNNFINNGGNLGIGTSNPQAKLHIIQNTIQDTNTNIDDQINMLRFNVNSGSIAAPQYSYGFRLVQLNKPNIGTQLNLYGGSVGSADNLALSIVSNGNVGIGTTDAKFPLHVTGSYSTYNYYNQQNNSFDYYNFDVSAPREWQNATSNFAVTISSQEYVWATGFLVGSDRRIKENISDVPDNLSLETLRKIPVRYYEYKDKIKKGFKKTIGFIAQEVDEHFPIAVSKFNSQIIPNEYRRIENPNWENIDVSGSDISNNKIMYKLTISDLVDVSENNLHRFIVSDLSGNFKDDLEIKSMENDKFSFLFEKKWDKIFLYGKEVNDFHTIDKPRLFALNFSATQELDKKVINLENELSLIKDKNVDLQNKNNNFQTEINVLKLQNQTLQDRLEAIEKRLYDANI